MTSVRIVDLAPDRMSGDVVAGFFFEDQRPLRGAAALLDWRLNGVMTDLLLSGGAGGAPGEHVLIGNNGKLQASWVLFAGGGSWRKVAPFTYAGLIGGLLDDCRRAGFQRISLCLTPPEKSGDRWLQDLAESLDTFGSREEIFLTLREKVG
jgi:hypothetical protein